MTIPENNQGVPPEQTSSSPAASPEPITQPNNIVLELQQKLEETERLTKRYKEQLVGKDVLLEQYKLQISQIDQPSYEELEMSKSKPTPIKQDYSTILTIQNTKKLNELDMREKYANDLRVPWTSDLSKEVKKEIDLMDVSGNIAVNPLAWEKAYEIVRGKRLEIILEEQNKQAQVIKQKELDELKRKESSKVIDTLETSVKPSETKIPNTFEEDLIKLNTKELEKKYPDKFGMATYKKYFGVDKL